MKIKVISNGTTQGTRVLTENGEKIEGCVSAEWKIDMENIAQLTLKFVGVGVEVEGDLMDVSEFGDEWKQYKHKEIVDEEESSE